MNKIAQINIGSEFGSPIGQPGFGLADLVSIILSNAIIIAGIIVLFLFIGGGISIIAGAGQDNPERAARGKQAVTAAAIGFIIIFATYWIIQLIEIITGVDIFRPIINGGGGS